MRRRTFLVGSGLALAGGASAVAWQRMQRYPVEVIYPGRTAGHRVRDVVQAGAYAWPSQADLTTDVLIIGSGAAALACAWTLERQGHTRWTMLRGPQPDGNLGGVHWAGSDGALDAPGAAHYLPLPSPESTHVRELLADLGILEGDPQALAPAYDERVIVHAPQERVWFQGQWHEGLLPTDAVGAEEAAEHNRFFAHMETLKTARGADGRRVFTIPLALASADPAWRALDRLNFDAWLDREGYRSPTLRWYLDYACRDDFGASAKQASAWAGLHYFCSRNGQAANAHPGAVLTWPGGLSALAQRMRQRLALDGPNDTRAFDLTALAVRESTQTPVKGSARSVDVLAISTGAAQGGTHGAAPRLIHARRVVLACPLHIGLRIAPELGGLIPEAERPQTASWLVGNFLLDGFPRERDGAELAWDNVVCGSSALGYVVSTHQWMRRARPAQTVFTSYRSLADRTPLDARRWLETAGQSDLLDAATQDLREVYGWRFAARVQRAQVRALGHAMAIPAPGFLDRAGSNALRALSGPLLYAHGDLSGMSVFEEAAWWGCEAARKILA